MELTERQKGAIAIAQDVLANLNNYNISDKGYYLQHTQMPTEDYFTNKNNNTNLQEILPILEKCRVCALGSCFLSFVRLFNNVTFNQLEYIYEGRIFNFLNDYFDRHNLYLIEMAFERKKIHYKNIPWSYNAIHFCNDIESPKERLKLIMENIIENNGVFDVIKS